MVPFSCFSAVGFVYVGIRARRPAWWIAGIVYTVVANVCFFFGSEGAEDSLQQNLAFTIMFLLWPISVAHALVINASWLRWRAGHVPWYAQPQQAPWANVPAPVATPLPPQLEGVVPSSQEFYGGPPGSEPARGPLAEPAPGRAAEPVAGWSAESAGGRAAEPAPAWPAGPVAGWQAEPVAGWSAEPAGGRAAEPAPAWPAGPAPGPLEPAPNSPAGSVPGSPAGSVPGSLLEPAPERLDVNTADAQQLAAVPGLTPQRVADVVAARQTRGGFTSLGEFAAVAGLAPHEFVAVRDRLSCEPPPQANQTPFGRIVDV